MPTAPPESREVIARQAWSHIASLFLGSEMHDRFQEACAAVDLPHPGALKLLILLADGDPPSMSDIARRMSCDASYVTGLVDALESQHYVDRVMSPSDRRVKLIHLTAAGRRAHAKAIDVVSTPPKAMERLSDAQVRSLARLLARIADR